MISQFQEGWIDCWSVPNLALAIHFLYHPVHVPGPKAQAGINTPDREDSLLGPLRPFDEVNEDCRSSIGAAAAGGIGEVVGGEVGESAVDDRFDPDVLEPDVCKVDLEVGPSVVFLYGTLIRNFMHVKENLFGEDQTFTAMSEQVTDKKPNAAAAATGTVVPRVVGDKEFDEREYRPLSVTLDITAHDLQANLVKYCAPREPPCPFLCVEKLVFEMDKSFRETRLQLLLSPIFMKVSDLVEEKTAAAGLTADLRKQPPPALGEQPRQGNLMLTGLQFRGHAIFSDIDMEPGGDTLEYGWMMELTCGSLCGKVSIPQLYSVVMSLETLACLTVDKENVMKHPRPYKKCQHNRKQKECIESHEEVLCPTGAEVKYKMLRASVDSVDVNIVDKCTAVRLQACPIRLATCNLHGQQTHQVTIFYTKL